MSTLIRDRYNDFRRTNEQEDSALIGVIFGKKGSGKTKQILNHANETAKTAKGSIVFIDDDNSYMFELASSIRFINASDYEIRSSKMLYGFICGIAAQDHDLECIYIDGFKSYIHHSLEDLKGFFQALSRFSDKTGTNVVLSISGSEELPDYLKDMTTEIE